MICIRNDADLCYRFLIIKIRKEKKLNMTKMMRMTKKKMVKKVMSVKNNYRHFCGNDIEDGEDEEAGLQAEEEEEEVGILVFLKRSYNVIIG